MSRFAENLRARRAARGERGGRPASPSAEKKRIGEEKTLDRAGALCYTISAQ